MVTLTLDPSDPVYAAALTVYAAAGGKGTSAPSVVHARESWNRLSVALRRSFGPLHYFKGIELTKAGTAHLHVLVRVASVQDFWRLAHHVHALAVRAHFGPRVDVVLARSAGDVGRYVTKAEGVMPGSRRDGSDVAAYATKGIDGRFPKWTRRASWSKAWSGWNAPTAIAGYTWRVAPASVETVRAALIASDFVMADPAAFRVPVAPAAPGGGVLCP